MSFASLNSKNLCWMKLILLLPENSHTITIPVLLVRNLKIFKTLRVPVVWSSCRVLYIWTHFLYVLFKSSCDWGQTKGRTPAEKLTCFHYLLNLIYFISWEREKSTHKSKNDRSLNPFTSNITLDIIINSHTTLLHLLLFSENKNDIKNKFFFQILYIQFQ